jgi:hypothetical protein
VLIIYRHFVRAIVPDLFVLALAAGISCQRIAVLTPERSPLTDAFTNSLHKALEKRFNVLDAGLAAAAYDSIKVDAPFNQTSETAQRIGTVIGCDHFLLIKTDTSRRTSSARPSYYEASAFVWVVNSRTGSLIGWLLSAKQGNTATDAEGLLVQSAGKTAEAIESSIKTAPTFEAAPEFEMFDPDSKVLRPAMPYKRIKPEYTSTAYLFDVKATVDAVVSIDEKGGLRQIDITRWAGFGLDTSVTDAIRKMNWRAGERNGKPLPLRVLLRYNFTKIEKE